MKFIQFSFLFVLPNLFFSLILRFSTQFYAVVSRALHFHFSSLVALFIVYLFFTFRNHYRVFRFVSLFRPFTSACVVLCVTHDVVETILNSNVNSWCRVDGCTVTVFDHESLVLIRSCPSLVAKRMYRVSRSRWSGSQIWWTGRYDQMASGQWSPRWFAWLLYGACHSSSSWFTAHHRRAHRREQVGLVKWLQVGKHSIMCQNLFIRTLAVNWRIKALNNSDYVFYRRSPVRVRRSSSIVPREWLFIEASR
jgi:hypothetical protein